jgi:hypothetical protein
MVDEAHQPIVNFYLENPKLDEDEAVNAAVELLGVDKSTAQTCYQLMKQVKNKKKTVNPKPRL